MKSSRKEVRKVAERNEKVIKRETRRWLNIALLFFLFLPLYTWVYHVLMRYGRIKIHNMERFPKIGKEKCIFIVNHPTYLEPPLSYLPFYPLWTKGICNVLRSRSFKDFARNFEELEKTIPRSPVNAKYVDNPIVGLLGVRIIFYRIDKNEGEAAVKSRASAIRQVRKDINEMIPPIFPPEGTRTKNHPPENRERSKKGNIIGQFEPGVGLLAKITGAPIISIGWIGGEEILPNTRWAFPLLFLSPVSILFRRKTSLEGNIGVPLLIPKGMPTEEADKEAMKRLLATLDEITLEEVR